MSFNRRSIPTADEATPNASDHVDEPMLVIWDGVRCGPKNVRTRLGDKDVFAARVITRKGDAGRVLFFWAAVIKQLEAALRRNGDGAFITVYKKGRVYEALEVTDEATINALTEIYEAGNRRDGRPYDDRDAPAEETE